MMFRGFRVGGVKSITNSRLSLSWVLKKWQRDMIQCPLLFTIGSSYDWIHLTVTQMKARLVTSDHAMKAHKSLYWSEKDLQKFVVCFSDIWWLSWTIPTTLPTIPYPRTTLPWHSQPWGHSSPMDPSPLYFHHHDTLSLHHYLLLSCYFVIPCFLISLILPCTHCPSPGYLVHLS